MSVDELSISFASSIGLENIKEEYLARNNANNLYTDLDQLEKSVDAEFEQYMNQARSFPFHEQDKEQVSREHPDLKDASVHSDYEILGANLLDQVNDELDGKNDSWQRYLKNNAVDEKYNVKPLRNNNSQPSTTRKEEKSRGEEEEEYADYSSRNTSPGEYFGARSMPLNSIDNVWQQHKNSNKSYLSHHTHQSLQSPQSRYPRSSQGESNAYSFVSIYFVVCVNCIVSHKYFFF